MPSIEPEELPRRRGRQELLDHIYSEGERRRRRRRAGRVGLSAVAALAVGAAVMAGLPAGTPQQVATRGATAPAAPGSPTSGPGGAEGGGEATTTSVAEPTTTVALEPARPLAPTTVARPVTTTTPLTATTAAPPTTVAGPICLNSTDEACGPFRWEPEPEPNQPLTIDVTATPRPDDPRTFDFAVVYTDPDAPVDDGCRGVSFGDGNTTYTGSSPGCVVAVCLAAYGPWTPPVPEPDRVEAAVSHTYAEPGTYTVSFSARSLHSLCHDPYGSYGDRKITVVVP